MTIDPLFVVPAPLFETLDKEHAWLNAAPDLAATYLERWKLQLDGEPLHGMASVVLPVVRTDGTPAVLKLQPPNEENVAEALALRTWPSDAVVEVLEDEPADATILLERLEPRSLDDIPDDIEATQLLAELLARLSAVQAPAEVRRLDDVVAAMLDEVPRMLPRLADQAEQELVRRYAAQVAELVQEPGDRLLHWDLHYGNVMGAKREPWLVIDPKPLAGDPCFELFQALNNRWDDLVATGDVPRAIRRRFDLMVEVVGLDRDRAVGWTLGRILQNALWDLGGGENDLDPDHLEIAGALLNRSS
jgi:streptomycin 6-kinase